MTPQLFSSHAQFERYLTHDRAKEIPRDRSARWSRGESRAHVRKRFGWHQGRAWKGRQGHAHAGLARCVKSRVVACSPAQQSNHGSIRVLAAFASEGMGLRRHIETVVKPWLTANTRWALNNHRLLLGAYEDVEQQNEFDLLQIVEDLVGGYWEKPLSKWEGRRDGVLDLIGKATPGTFQPSLQIDGTGAKLLIEALSGR